MFVPNSSPWYRIAYSGKKHSLILIKMSECHYNVSVPIPRDRRPRANIIRHTLMHFAGMKYGIVIKYNQTERCLHQEHGSQSTYLAEACYRALIDDAVSFTSV